MRPVAFDFFAPTSLEEAIELLGRFGPDAVVLAGGQTLMPLMNMRLIRPAQVVDLNRIKSLSFLASEDGELRLGATTRQYVIETSDVVGAACPILKTAAGFVGQPHTRSRGTIGGVLAFGSSAAEFGVVLTATGGQVLARGPEGTRMIPIEEFYLDYLTTALEPGEILTEVRIPHLPADASWGFAELKLRGCDFPIVVCAVVATIDPAGLCQRIRIAVGPTASTPIRLSTAERQLVGNRFDDETIRAAAATAFEEADPADDLVAPAAYRREVAKDCVERALRMALAQRGQGV